MSLQEFVCSHNIIIIDDKIIRGKKFYQLKYLWFIFTQVYLSFL